GAAHYRTLERCPAGAVDTSSSNPAGAFRLLAARHHNFGELRHAFPTPGRPRTVASARDVSLRAPRCRVPAGHARNNESHDPAGFGGRQGRDAGRGVSAGADGHKVRALVYRPANHADRTVTGNERDPHPFAGEYLWHQANNRFGWTALLVQARGSPCVSAYASPARAEGR